MTDREEVHERIEELARRARRDASSFTPPDTPPAPERAMEYLRTGAGPAIWLYVEARVDGFVQIEPDAFRRLEGSMNRWLELYARCYGVDLDAEFSIRTAAETLLETHNIKDVAIVLTRVPDGNRATD